MAASAANDSFSPCPVEVPGESSRCQEKKEPNHDTRNRHRRSTASAQNEVERRARRRAFVPRRRSQGMRFLEPTLKMGHRRQPGVSIDLFGFFFL
jgi:hypothetical protein